MHIKQGILTIQGERLMITDYKYVQLPYWQNTMKLQKKKINTNVSISIGSKK